MIAPRKVSYVFDVDGTLTPSRCIIEPATAEFMLNWVRDKQVYLLTGSDASKTIEQLGENLWKQFTSYQCNGNEVYVAGIKTFSFKWPSPGLETEKIVSFLEGLLDESSYPHRFGVHVELRTGMINFSSIGRACGPTDRKEYFRWDSEKGERKYFCKAIMDKFPTLVASIGGEISIDIYPKGKDKGQVYDLLSGQGPIYFFGDRMEKGGNDYSMACKLKNSKIHKNFAVTGPDQTIKILKSL
jgi:phosphomannomutase